MTKRALVWVLGGAAVLVSLSLPSAQQAVREVFVTNFPEVWTVKGRVQVEGPIRRSELVRFGETVVPPVQPNEIPRLISGGVLQADGYPAAVLSLSGLTKANVLRAGKVGAILVPNETEIVQAFERDASVQFPLEVSTPVPAGNAAWVSSSEGRIQLGFPGYRVYFYNTTDKAITVRLYAYLTD